MTVGPKKRGRKSKAEELGLLDDKEALLEQISHLSPEKHEADAVTMATLAAVGMLRGLLSRDEAAAIQNAAAIGLRARKQVAASEELARWEKVVSDARAIREAARVESAQARAKAQS